MFLRHMMQKMGSAVLAAAAAASVLLFCAAAVTFTLICAAPLGRLRA